MYHYQPATALEELEEEAVLPHPVHVRDMLIRARLSPKKPSNCITSFRSICMLSGSCSLWPAAFCSSSRPSLARAARPSCHPQTTGRHRSSFHWIVSQPACTLRGPDGKL